MKKLSIILLAMIFTIGGNMTAKADYEEPKFKILKEYKDKDIEIRKYEPYLIAKTEVTGDRKESINKGFRVLADYIFGNNTVKQKISMTAPVTQQESVKMAMTTPVTQQQTADDNKWVVTFKMPNKYDLENIPKPNNDKVILEKIESYKAAAITFSGLSSQGNLEEHEKELFSFIKANKLKIIGMPYKAFYNPPWTPWFLRRNEIIVQIE